FRDIQVTQNPTNEELQTLYNEKQGQFMEPERRSLKIIQITKDNVKNDVADLESEAAYNAMYKLSIELEDTLASGTSYEDAAKTFGLKLSTVSDINVQGLNLQNQMAPITSKLLEEAFSLNEGDES